jgi:HAMP domain-containing protein
MTTLLAASASSSAAPGTLGFIIVFALAVVLVFMFRSMSKHIRKVNNAARREEAGDLGAEATQAGQREPAARAGQADDGSTIR